MKKILIGIWFLIVVGVMASDEAAPQPKIGSKVAVISPQSKLVGDTIYWDNSNWVRNALGTARQISMVGTNRPFYATLTYTDIPLDNTAYDATTYDGVSTKAVTWDRFRDVAVTLAPIASPTFTGSATFGAATGVSITGSNGTITFLGTGDGADESLTYDHNTTANTIGISSVSGVTAINYSSAITIQKNGVAYALVAGDIGAATATTPSAGDNDTSVATTAYVKTETSATQSGVHATPTTTNPLSPTWSGPVYTVWYGATGTINLPAASTYAGRAILIYNTGSFTITIDPNSSEVVVRDGTVQTGGVNFTLSSGAGNYVAIWCDGARWVTLGYKGSLAAGS